MSCLPGRGGLLLAGALIALATAGCGPGEPQPGSSDGGGAPSQAQLPADVQAQLDSGNVAYRAELFEEARTHFRRAAELGPELAAPWFGVYMVEHRLGNTAAADSAFRRAQGADPSANLVHPTPVDTVRPAGASGSSQGGVVPDER